MDRQRRLQRIAELEADRDEVDVELARYDVLRARTDLTRIHEAIYEWLWQRRKEIRVQLLELHNEYTPIEGS